MLEICKWYFWKRHNKYHKKYKRRIVKLKIERGNYDNLQCLLGEKSLRYLR